MLLALNTVVVSKERSIPLSTEPSKLHVSREQGGRDRISAPYGLPSFVDQNPLIWMLEVNGFIMDVRHAPREVKEIAFAKGLIPYIPADREGGQ